MECFVYVLGSCGPDGYRTYVGWTNDLERRIARHNAGTGARSTRGRVWFLLYAERHDSARSGDEPRVVFEARPVVPEEANAEQLTPELAALRP